jgi:hypothetical protein
LVISATLLYDTFERCYWNGEAQEPNYAITNFDDPGPLPVTPTIISTMPDRLRHHIQPILIEGDSFAY